MTCLGRMMIIWRRLLSWWGILRGRSSGEGGIVGRFLIVRVSWFLSLLIRSYGEGVRGWASCV